MYRYKLGYHSCEESGYVELEHEKQFSKEELVDMIGDATVQVIKRMKQQPLDEIYLHSFQDICSGIWCEGGYSLAEAMIELFGFKSIIYENSISFFGWASIFAKNDWEEYRDEEDGLNKVVDKVLAAGFSEADDTYIQHQKESHERYLKEHPEAKEK